MDRPNSEIVSNEKSSANRLPVDISPRETDFGYMNDTATVTSFGDASSIMDGGSELGFKKSQSDDGIRRGSEDISLRTIQNPSDSLNLLAQAAFTSYDSDESGEKIKTGIESSDESVKLSKSNSIDSQGQVSPQSKIKESPDSPNLFKERLSKFCLVKAGILSPITLKTLVSTYFSRHHQYMPIRPVHKILGSDSELCTLAEEEPILTVTFVIIASRFEDEKVHAASWKFMSEIINDLVLGLRKPTLGAIEALLTLSENVPKCEQVNDKDLYEFEERFSWHLVGQAVRMSYYLGLDQKTLLESSETMSAETHRMRFIWTYCHFEERQTSIRFGKAFWSRGPTLCFPGNSYNASTGPESLHNFRTLIPSATSSEDYSSYMQALIESTNLLSNIHDLLYPSRDRTISLVHLGDYHKILDELTMGFATYRMTWEKKYWDTLSLNETVWVSFNYAKLYAYGFAFEAHMKRMTDSSSERLDSQNMFPMSMSATSDAKFIIEAKNAAIEILTSCVDNLHSFGAMAYLPARYYGYFGHAAVFLIKLIFTEAVNYAEQRDMLALIRRSIACFCDEFKGLDRYHPLIRCAQQLRTLLQTLWTSRDNCSDNKNFPENGPENHFNHSHLHTIPDSLTDDIFNLVDDFSFDQFFSPDLIRESAEAAVQDLATTFSNDLNGDYWLSYFN